MNVGHRRAHSEISFRFPDDFSLFFDGGVAAAASMEADDHPHHHHHNVHDDLLATYMDMEKIMSDRNDNDNDNNNDDISGNYVDFMDHNCSSSDNKLRHSFSVDGFSGFSSSNNDNNNNNNHNYVNDDNNNNNNDNNNHNVRKNNRDATGEAKKAMSPDKLAELWVADPKRAKRILANRQSAARSKERKARYIVELEKKVQALQTDATALSAQLSLFERDTGGLTSENTDLRRQLESMEQQAQLRDALNDALQQELDRLKVATGETSTSADAFIMPSQQGTPDTSKSKLLPLYPFDSTMSNSHNNMDSHSHRSKMPPLHSFEFINISCAPHNTAMTNNLHSSYQPVDLPKVKSQQQFSYETNLLGLPRQAPRPKGPQLYPLETNLYLPVESSKPTMPQFCTIDTNQHCPSQHNGSPLGHLPQFPMESNSQSPEHEVYVTTQSPMLGEMTSQDHLSRFQGLDLSGRGSHLVKVEGPSIIASESMGF